METVRFADILFILLVCAITGGILLLVNRKRTGPEQDDSKTVPLSDNVDPEKRFQPSDEDN